MNIKQLKILDKVFQNYLDYNDDDEEARDLYLEMLSPLEYDIVKNPDVIFPKGAALWNMMKSIGNSAEIYNIAATLPPLQYEAFSSEGYKREILRQRKVESDRLAAIEAERLQKIIDDEENRLAKQLEEKVKQDEIKRNQIILKPEIIPAVVTTSSLIPLAIIAFLLINSRKDKK